VWKAGDTEGGTDLVHYRKAPLQLAKLEQEIGSELFLEWIQKFIAKKGATTPFLLDTLESVAGEKHREHFEQLLGE
jgi:aminopeptidase N